MTAFEGWAVLTIRLWPGNPILQRRLKIFTYCTVAPHNSFKRSESGILPELVLYCSSNPNNKRACSDRNRRSLLQYIRKFEVHSYRMTIAFWLISRRSDTRWTNKTCASYSQYVQTVWGNNYFCITRVVWIRLSIIISHTSASNLSPTFKKLLSGLPPEFWWRARYSSNLRLAGECMTWRCKVMTTFEVPLHPSYYSTMLVV